MGRNAPFIFCFLGILLVVLILWKYNYLDAREGFTDTPSSMTLAQFQDLFTKAGCTNTLTDKDITWWKTRSSVDAVKADMKAYADLTANCAGTDSQHMFCKPFKNCEKYGSGCPSSFYNRKKIAIDNDIENAGTWLPHPLEAEEFSFGTYLFTSTNFHSESKDQITDTILKVDNNSIDNFIKVNAPGSIFIDHRAGSNIYSPQYNQKPKWYHRYIISFSGFTQEKCNFGKFFIDSFPEYDLMILYISNKFKVDLYSHGGGWKYDSINNILTVDMNIQPSQDTLYSSAPPIKITNNETILFGVKLVRSSTFVPFSKTKKIFSDAGCTGTLTKEYYNKIKGTLNPYVSGNILWDSFTSEDQLKQRFKNMFDCIHEDKEICNPGKCSTPAPRLASQPASPPVAAAPPAQPATPPAPPATSAPPATPPAEQAAPPAQPAITCPPLAPHLNLAMQNPGCCPEPGVANCGFNRMTPTCPGKLKWDPTRMMCQTSSNVNPTAMPMDYYGFGYPRCQTGGVDMYYYDPISKTCRDPAGYGKGDQKVDTNFKCMLDSILDPVTGFCYGKNFNSVADAATESVKWKTSTGVATPASGSPALVNTSASQASGVSSSISPSSGVSSSTPPPSSQPSSQPAPQPVSQPAPQPSSQPSSQSSSQPVSQPSSQPVSQPAPQPSSQPSSQSSLQPTVQATAQLSSQPTSQPASQPTSQPASQTFTQPTQQPAQQSLIARPTPIQDTVPQASPQAPLTQPEVQQESPVTSSSSTRYADFVPILTQAQGMPLEQEMVTQSRTTLLSKQSMVQGVPSTTASPPLTEDQPKVQQPPILLKPADLLKARQSIPTPPKESNILPTKTKQTQSKIVLSTTNPNNLNIFLGSAAVIGVAAASILVLRVA